MKIAQLVSLEESVPPKSKNGLEFIVSWLTEELVRRGHKVTLFAPANSKTHARLIPIFPQGTTNEDWLVWNKKNYSDWNTSLAASLNHKFDIIHSHTGTIFHFLPFIQKPVIYTVHEPYDDRLRQKYLTNKKYFKSMEFIIDQYKKVFFVNISQKQQNNFKKCQPYYFKKFKLIYNGIPIEKFTFNVRPDNYLLYLGYLNYDKGADVAIKIAKKIKMKLFLAGETKKSFYQKEVRPYLDKNIRYLGPVNFEQKNKLFKNALALLAPLNWEEPFGLVPVEAQACGTPVVAFNKGSMPEIIQHNKTGFVVNTEKEMIAAIKKINQIKRQDCRQWVEQNFTVEKMVDNYEKLYQKLIRKKRI